MRAEFSDWIRLRAYESAAGLCQTCGKHVGKGDYHVDHIIPDGIGGKPTIANAQILCNDCHNEKTRKQDVPRIAKTKRQQRKHLGTWRASRRPVPGSKRSRWRRPLRGPAEPRIYNE